MKPIARVCLINALQAGRRVRQGLKPSFFQALNGTAEEAAEKLNRAPKSPSQALKRVSIFNDLTARVNSCPSQSHPNRSFSGACEAVPHPKPIYGTHSKLLHLIVLIVVGNSLLLAADRGTLVREAVIYLSPDTTSSKLAQVERGRELILLDEATTGCTWKRCSASAQTPDPAFVLEDEDEGKTISGWVLDTGVVWASTPNGDRILFGAAVDSEDEASRRHGRRGAAQDALRLYRRVFDIFPASPLAGEGLYRAADIKWQIDKSDMQSRPSARERDPTFAKASTSSR